MTDEARRLPKGMGRRLWTMLWFTAALGFTGFGNINELAFMPFFAWIGVLMAMGCYALWRDRTRPKANGFWVLMAIVWAAAMVLPIRPYMGAVAAIPVALMWLHDSPGSPSAMVTWGMLATLSQDVSVWEAANVDTAFYVILAMVLVLAAAQAERERLAVRLYAPTSKLWMAGRLLAVLVWSLVLLAGREAIQAVSVFTYLGFDLSNIEGKITVLMLLLASLAAAALLFRRRPHKVVDPYEQPRDDKGRRVARQAAIDPPKVKAAKRAKPAPLAPKPRLSQPVKRTEAGKAKGPLKPGEIDFD